jgi:glucan phosphorylase
MNSELQQTAGQAADQAKQQVASLGQTAQKSAKTQLTTQKERATQGLGQVSDALHQTSTQLRQKNSPMGEYVDRAAQQVDKFGSYLQLNEVDQIVNDVQQFARRQPAVVLGGALIVGFLASRFMKSSSTPPPGASGNGMHANGYPTGFAGTSMGTYGGSTPPQVYPTASVPVGEVGTR